MIDMHIHTNNSDGQYKIEELIQMLKKLKIEIFSITDHDNIDSYIELEKLNHEKLKYITGIEYSSINGKYNCHILGYNIDYKNNHIIEECEIIKKRRYEKIKYILDILINQNIITETEAKIILNKKGTIGRMDICKTIKQKQNLTIPEIYDKYLTYKNLQTHRSKIEKITEIIKKSGGIPILAHPKEIEKDYNIDIEEFIKDFIEKGIEGIEVYNSIHKLEDAKRYIQIAKKYNLLTTGGSDFHGILKPKRILGTTTETHIKIKKQDLNFPF